MMEVRFRVSLVPSQGQDPVLSMTSWVAATLKGETMLGMTIHELVVEEIDA